MKRDILADLIYWKERKKHKPIIIRGARQVGKTTAIRELGSHFQNFVEINFEEKMELKTVFDGNLDPEGIIQDLNVYLGVNIQEKETLLFFDEIQECPNAIKAMRYFYEKKPDLHVIAAGSLLEFELERISFPVGRIEFLYMYPLSFGEYLTAINKSELRSRISRGDMLPEALHNQLLKDIRDYSIIGGMPEVVQEYISEKNYKQCQAIQTGILETFQADFHKYAKKHQVKYLETVFSGIPAQLGRKLKYTNLSNLYKSRDLGEALSLLEMAGLVAKVHHSSANGIPLEHEKDYKKFKTIFFDTGLAMRMLRIPLKDLIINPDISLINEGAIAEQLVGQELLAHSPKNEKGKLFYWHREQRASNAEVDYVVEESRGIIPIEVKSGKKNRMNSLRIFMEEKDCTKAYCLSQGPHAQMEKIHFYPLYAVEAL